MNAEELLADIARKLRSRSDVDSEVTEQVVENLLLHDDPVDRVDRLELVLHTIGMRRAGSK